MPVAPSFIHPDIDPSVIEHITGPRQKVLDQLIALMNLEAGKDHIGTLAIRVERYRPHLATDTRLLVTQKFAAPVERVDEFWDKFADAVDDWIRTLPRHQANIINDEILIAREWETHG